MYEGRTSVEVGKVPGHENVGIVQEAGVGRVKVGDRVSVPFNVRGADCGVEAGQSWYRPVSHDAVQPAVA
jgi:threonine dehydrogenase-like Zn-dependent dehydrogenase